MKLYVIFLFTFFNFIFAQTGKYLPQNDIDGPGINSLSKLSHNYPIKNSLFKSSNISKSGGKISDVTKHWTFLTDNVAATSNPLGSPLDMALDAVGNLYISLPDLHVVRKVHTNGNITTFAGNGTGGFSEDNVAANESMLNSPHGLVFDSSGNLYIADRGNMRVRKVDTNGIITTVAGIDSEGYSGDGGSATAAQLNHPYDVVFDASGNLYISEKLRIRKVDTNGIITIFAGDGGDDFSGDGGAATNAGLDSPAHMAIDQSGNLYFADFNHHVVRKIDTNGVITSVYGVGGAAGNSNDSPKKLNTPFGVAYEREKIDALGLDEDILYIIDYHNHCIVQIILRGKDSGEPQSGNAYVDADILWGKEGTSGFDGDGDTAWDETARFYQPETMITNFTTTSTGWSRIYHIADFQNQRVRKIVEEGVIATDNETSSMSTVAGADVYNGTNIAANTARMNIPRNSAIDKDGNYYVADQGNHLIRKIDTNGVITTVAGNGTKGYYGSDTTATHAPLNNPRAVAVDSKYNLYISDTGNNLIKRVDANGIMSSFAGIQSSSGYSGDGGPASSAKIDFPYQIAVDASDNIYFADNENHVIRKIDSDGNISTVAGKGENSGYSGDGGQATDANLNSPLGVAIDADGNLYIGDYSNHVIRKVDTNGVITTLAGQGGVAGYMVGDIGTSGKLNYPSVIAVDSKGNVYFCDTGNNVVSRITTDGYLQHVVGSNSAGYSSTDSIAYQAEIDRPYGITIDANDNIYLSDSWNYLVRKITPRTSLKVPSEYGTIGTAIGASFGGDTILVAAGIYVENLNLENPDNGKRKSITIIGEDRNTTIIDGNQNGSVVNFSKNGRLVMKNLTIQNGTGHEGAGGGLKISEGSAYLSNVTIKNNTVSVDGGGIWAQGTNITINDSKIMSNTAAQKGGGIMAMGGGAGSTHSGLITLQDVYVENNTASQGGGVYINNTGASFISKVHILNNHASNEGGGIAINTSAEDQELVNLIIADNTAQYRGAGIVIHNNSFSIKNSTIVNNKAVGPAGGLFVSHNTVLDVDNSIFWGNSPHQIWVDDNLGNEPNTLSFNYSDVQGGESAIPTNDKGTITWGTGNIDKYPSFVDSVAYNFALADWSPLIGVGRDGNDIGAFENQYSNPQNAPPVLSPLPDVSVNEDSSITVSLVAINADNVDNDPITYSATSEKSEVKLSFGSVSSKLGINAEKDWNGLSLISVQASDGTDLDNANFTVKFIPVNDQPIINNLSSDTTNEETSRSIQITASDIDGDELSISATTDNDNVIPSVNGMILTLTPSKDFVGNTMVKVIVSDGSLSDTASYQLTVLNVNDAPVISEIKDQRIAEDSDITITVNATDIDDTILSFTGNGGSSGISTAFSDSILTIKPQANWNGNTIITVYASDGKDMDSTKFKLIVDPMQDAPYDFEWVSMASDSIYISQTNLDSTYDLEWSESKDVDGETIDYLLHVQIGIYPAEEIYDTTSTSVQITFEEFVENVFELFPMLPGATVRFSVIATDGIDTVKVTGDDRVLFVNRYDYLSIAAEGVPLEFALHDNYPNPFNPTTTLRFDLPEVSDITLIIYNMLGQKVRTFDYQNTSAGYHSVTWDATNDLGQQVGAGVYLYQLQAKGFVKTRKMVLLK